MMIIPMMMVVLFAAFSFQSAHISVDAFTVGGGSRSNILYSRSTSTSTSTTLFDLPHGYQEFGDDAIRKAARQCGMVLEDDDDEGESDGKSGDDDPNKNRLDIEWKAGSIIVTVHGEVSLRASSSEAEDEEGSNDDDDDDDDDDETPFGDTEEDEAEDDGDEETEEEEEFSLTLLARTINRILDDDGTGLAIAEVHSIEVTTPGVSDELIPGTPQFEAFKGFEVIVQQLDPKKKKGNTAKQPLKTIEGRLVERNDEFTIINIKGRMKKMKNETVVSVRLPKAKTEKGGR